MVSLPPFMSQLLEKSSFNVRDSVLSDDVAAVKKKPGFFDAATLISLFVILDIIGIAIVIFLFVLYYKRAKKKKEETQLKEIEVEVEKVQSAENEPTTRKEEVKKLTFLSDIELFELDDLFKASAEGLGKGNFGSVYKAKIENGPAVVVKRLTDLRPLTDEEFADQMRALADLKHPNLLPPLAYYNSKDEKLLVHTFVQNGNLFNRLFGRRGRDRIPFKWNSRLNVAIGVARALELLYINTTHATIPHGNLKSSNILLDANDMAIVSDYGMNSLIAQPIAAQRMSAFKCPEFQTRKKMSKGADVWSYGSIVLELLTGKISICSAPQGINGVDISSWVNKAIREEWTAEIFDPEISRQTDAPNGMFQLLQIALNCCEKSPEKRLHIEEVVRKVEAIQIYDSEEGNSSDSSFDLSKARRQRSM